MGALTPPRPALVETALDISRQWCAGHLIDGSPALGHAVKEGTDLDAVLNSRLSPAVTRIVKNAHDVMTEATEP